MKIWFPVVTAIVLLVAVLPASAQVVIANGVAEEATAANSQPKIARDQRGTIYLAFVKPMNGVAQVFLASSNDDGKSWQVQPVTTGSSESRYPSLAVGPDNRVAVAWTQYDGGVGKVYYSQFDGQRWTPHVRVSGGATYAGIPAVAIAPQNQVHLVWYGIRNQAPIVQTRHGSIYEILYTARIGTQWTSPEVISPGIPDSINPTLGIDLQGRLHSAWYQYDLRAYQVRYRMHERAWSQSEQVSQGEDASSVAMAIGRTGIIYLVWERHETNGTRIYFAERNQRWSPQRPLSPEGQPAEAPSVAVDDRGEVYVVWASKGTIHLTRRSGDWLGVDRLSMEGQNTNPILINRREGVDLIWTQRVGDDRRLLFAALGMHSVAVPSWGPTSVWGVVVVAVLIVAAWQWRRMRRIARES